MGVYVTRNKDTYLHGQMMLTENVCYGNGINGLVFHRTDRGIVSKNVIYNNGVVPGASDDRAEDWQVALSKGRQPYSGLVLNNAKGVKLWSNVVRAKHEEDYAYTMAMDKGVAKPVVIGGNNQVCRGKVDLNPMKIAR